MSISQGLELFRADYIAVRCLSKSTDANYRDAIKNFTRNMGDMELRDIDPQTVVQWRHKMERQMAASCVRCYLSKLKNLLVFTNKRGLTNFDISEFHLPKVPRSLPKYLKPHEIEQMMEHAGSLRNRCIISFLFASGIRASELKRLDRTDIQGSQVYIRQGKGNTSRTVFINNQTIQLVDEYLRTRTDGSPILFYSMKKGRLDISYLLQIVKKAAKQAGIKRNVTTHMMRHSFATNLIRNGCDIAFVQRFLGHQFISTTQLYVHLENEDLARAYKQFQNAY